MWAGSCIIYFIMFWFTPVRTRGLYLFINKYSKCLINLLQRQLRATYFDKINS